MTSLEVTLRLLSMEAGFVLLTGLLGSGLGALISGEVPRAARVAVAPAIGLAVGFPLMLTASQFMPMSVGAFAVLVPLALLSAAYAAWRARRGWSARPAVNPGHAVGLALAVSLPLVLLSAPLIEERSLGPVSYQVADAATYADFQDHLDDHTWRDEHFGLGEGDDRLVDDFLSSPVFQTGTIPLAAALSATFGWSALDSQSALMIAFVAIGCLGCFALVLTATKSSWAGVAAALLYAGPVNYQLFIDGSQAALAALALLGPLAIVASRIFHEPVRAGALLGLLVGGLMTVYPSFLPVVAVGFVLALAIRLTRARRADLAKAAVTASAAAVLAVVVLAPVSLAKNVSYVRAVSQGQLDKPAGEAMWDEPIIFTNFGDRVEPFALKDSFPPFEPPAEAAPSWITQSHERYDLLAFSDVPRLDAAVLGVALPLLVFALAALGAFAFRGWAFLLLGVAVSLVLAYYAFHGQDCSYCGQRALLAIPPIVVVLACCGLVAAAGWIAARSNVRRETGVVVAAAAALALVGVALFNDRALAERLVDGGYLLRDEAREVLDEATGDVLVEGAGVGNPYTAYFESSLLPQAVREATGEQPLLDPSGLAIGIFPDQFPPEVPANADYPLVFTRVGDIETDRPVVIRRGPYALEQRVAPLDATVVSGVVADLVQRDPAGTAWVTGPVTVLVADSDRAPASLVLELTGPEAASLRLGGDGSLVNEDGRALVCVPVPGRDPMRRVTVPLRFEEAQYAAAPDPTDPPIPGMALQLESLRAARECPSAFEH